MPTVVLCREQGTAQKGQHETHRCTNSHTSTPSTPEAPPSDARIGTSLKSFWGKPLEEVGEMSDSLASDDPSRTAQAVHDDCMTLP